MPDRPFTRFLALALVLAFCLILNLPGDTDLQSITWALAALPVPIILLMWSAVKGAPIFESRAFHRTLPVSRALVFWRTLRWPLVVLLGAVLAVAICCVRMNFGFRVLSYGWALTVFPLVAAMGLFGLAATLATQSGSRSKFWSVLVLFSAPIFGSYWVMMAALGQDDHEEVLFTNWRTIVLACALIYPLCWWLVSVRSRRLLGSALGAALGVMLPWLYLWGDLGPQIAEHISYYDPNPSVHLVRLPFPDGGEELSPDRLLKVEGLRDGELLTSWGTILHSGESTSLRKEFRFAWHDSDRVADDYEEEFGIPILKAAVLEKGEEATWGSELSRQVLLNHLPIGLKLKDWMMSAPRKAHGRMILKRPPSEAQLLSQGANLEESLSMEKLRHSPWIFTYSVESVGEPFVCEPGKGGTFRLPEGGRLVVDANLNRRPLPRLDGVDGLEIRYDREDVGSPWPIPGRMVVRNPPLVIAVDEPSGTAWIMATTDWVDGKAGLFGETSRCVVPIAAPRHRDDADDSWLQKFRRCRLYVFLPREALLKQVTLESPE